MPRNFCSGAGMGRGRGLGFGGGARNVDSGLSCRMFPWLPRRWWNKGGVSQGGVTPPSFNSAMQEGEYLQEQARLLKSQLGEIEKRLEQLGNKGVQK